MPPARISSMFAVLIAALMIFGRLGGLPLRDPDEGRNSEVSREMRAAGAWLLPTYNGFAYLDKPAFFFKAVAISFALFGESEWSARFPSALFATGILAMVFGFCHREYDDKVAALAVIVLATTPLFVALGRHVIFDMTLAFFVCGAIFSGYFAEMAEGSGRRLWYLLGAASAACATLVKGPVGFLVPTLVLAVFNMVDMRGGWWRRYFHPLNLFLFFVIVLPWFFGLAHLRPDFPEYGIMEESFRRFTSKSFHRSAPVYYYCLVILGGLFAWSVLLPEAAKAAWGARSRWTRADRLLIVWSLAVVIFFSISKSKLPHYIITALIALGILTARLFAAAFERKEGAAARIVFRGLAVLAALSLATVVFLLINVVSPDAHEKWFRIRSREYTTVSLVFGPAAGLLILIALAALTARWLRDLRIALATFLVLPLALVTVGFGALMQYSEASSSRALANRVGAVAPGTDVICLQSFPCGLSFYLKRFVTVITASGSEMTSNYIIYTLKKTQPWPAGVVPIAEKEQWLAARQKPAFLITSNPNKSALDEIAAKRNITVTELTPGWWGALLPPAK